MAAERASDPAVAKIHREMAKRYREIVETRLQLVPHPNVNAQAAGFSGA